MYLKFPARNTSLGKENNSVSDLKLDNEKLKIDNQNIKQRLQYLEQFIQVSQSFDSSKNVIDLRAFVQSNYRKFNEIIDESWKNQEECKLWKEKCQMLEKELHTAIQDKNKILLQNQSAPEQKIDQNTNNLIQELTIKYEKLYKQSLEKDFFREYELMCKEVEGLRNQNMHLSEQLQKMQEQ